jgi:hypothetical protein
MRSRASGFKMTKTLLRETHPAGSFKITALMRKRLTRHAQEMIERSLTLFPELNGQVITVGYTRKHLGSATVTYRKGVISALAIRLKVRKLTYQTIGHELTHLLQGLAHAARSRAGSTHPVKIPSGEKQCDIWTLARHELFCDDPPTYLRLPRVMRESWPAYAPAVRTLCMNAIEKRLSYRRYIHWLEGEIRKLAEAPRKENPIHRQLDLFLPSQFIASPLADR